MKLSEKQFIELFDAMFNLDILEKESIAQELTIKMRMPRGVFEDFMSPLTEEMVAVGPLTRDAAGHLIPTKTTAAVNRYEYTIKKGSVADKLFHLDTLDDVPSESPEAE